MKILFAGDSITNGFPFSRKEAFPDILGAKMGLEVVNLGANGISSGEVAGNLVMHMDTVCPDICHIMCGSNDFVFGSGSPEEACRNVRRAMNYFLEGAENGHFIVSVPPLTDAEMASLLWMPADYATVNRNLMEYRDMLEEMCTNHYTENGNETCSIHYFDLQNEYKKCGLYVDGVHPTIEGQQFIAAKLSALINTII